MAEFKRSEWGSGYYYPYTGEDGKEHGIPLFKWVYDKYCEPGFLTPDLMDEMLTGKTVTFNEHGNVVTAYISPYVTKEGRHTQIIKFKTDGEDKKPDDRAVIDANLEKIALAYWDTSSERFDYTKPQKVIDSLSLTKSWRTYATHHTIGDKRFGDIKIYRYGSGKSNNIQIYCEVNEKICTYLTYEQYKVKVKEEEERIQSILATKYQKEREYTNVKTNLLNWLRLEIVDKITNGHKDAINMTDLLANLQSLIASVDVPNIEDLVGGLINKTKGPDFNDIIEDSANYITHTLTIDNYTDLTVIDSIKAQILKSLKVFYEYNTVKQVRQNLWKRVQTEGLTSVVDSVNIDIALDLGNFKEVKRILLKYKSNVEKAIIFDMYKDVINTSDLQTKLLNLLKVYDEFYNMPEKDRKSLAKFIAKHKLSDYYDRISAYDDCVEVLIDESRDPKLLKPLLSSIAGTSRADCLKDKTYYFEKIGRVKEDVLVHKPIELLEKLKECIGEFNVASDVAVLTNIELDADESFIFQFYTFSDAGDGSDFDGRRMLNLTRIYNRRNGTQKIGFNFDK